MNIALISAYPPSLVTLNEYGYYMTKYFVQNSLVSKLYLITDYTDQPKLVDYNTHDKLEIVPCWNFNQYSSIFKILYAIHQSKADIVIINAHFLKFGDKKIPAAMGLMLSFLLKLMNYRSIFLIHNIMEKVDLKKAGFTENKVLQWIYNSLGNILTKFILTADLVAVTMDSYVKILEEKYKATNVGMIPHGSFDMPSKPNLNLPAGPPKVMAFGKFGTYKRVETMIEAVLLLRQKLNQEIEIVIAGTDSPNTIGYLDEMKSKYKDIPMIQFTGYVAESDVERIFVDSAAVVFPYTSTTGSSGVLHQAGGYGCAVVLPNIDDLAHLIAEEGYQGEYFTPDNASSMADAIEKIITNDTYRREMGLNNYQVATALPMNDIVRWYLAHAYHILKLKTKTNTTASIDLKIPSSLLTTNYHESKNNTAALITANQRYRIDCSPIEHIDLAGFNTLIHLYMVAVERNATIEFVGPYSSPFQTLIHHTKMDFIFH